MKTAPLLPLLAMCFVGCDLIEPAGECPTDRSEPTTTADTAVPTATEPDLTTEEQDALDTWMPTLVQFDLPGDKTATGHELAILFPDADATELDVVSSTTRSADYNSSRSNKRGIADVDDDPTIEVKWDGVVCDELPCMSEGQAPGASLRLTVDAGDALDDGDLAVSWADTTPRDIDVSGYLTLGCAKCRHRGHVTVLKAADNGNGGIDLTSPLEGALVWVPDPKSPGSPLYEAELVGGTNPLATIAGTTGDSWPQGVRVTETALGTLVSLTW